VERRGGHADAAGALEFYRGAVHRGRAVQRGAGGAGVRSTEHGNPRPSQLDRRIRTSIGLPNFPSYTSGHSTFSAAAAEVLSYLFPAGTERFEADKEEAAISRLYGGIHYRSDIEVGKSHGKRIGGYTVRFAQQDGADQ
jgi:membrane-associated phospholipid phosphatase